MSYVFTASQFAEKLLNIVSNYPTHYRGTNGSSAPQYNIGAWDGTNFCFDCSGVIKSVLWGWNGNKNASYGGAVYASNGVPDINDDASWGFGQYATHTDVLNAPKGALLWKQGHVGTSIGGGYAVECTPAFNGGVQKTAINGRGWSKWGYLPWIDYDAEEEPESHPVLEYGATGSSVIELQTRLNYHGNYGLALDGSFGPATKTAVLDFQSTHGLTADASVGPLTWAALLKSKRSVGDAITYNGIYTSSNSTSKLTPKYKEGTITQIVDGANNPYLVSSNGAIAGWTNDDCIEGGDTPQPSGGDLVNKFIAALAKNGDGRYCYWNGTTGIGCSDYVRMCLIEAGIGTQAECNSSTLWAAQCYRSFLRTSGKFQELPASTTPQMGDILWYHGAHVAVSAGGSNVYEAAPESSHGICSNGKTGVGLWRNHTYNCAGIPLTCIYRIIDNGSVTPTPEPEPTPTPTPEPTPEPTVTKLDYLGKLEEAIKVCKGTYGANPGRKEKLIELYGADTAAVIQKLVDISFKDKLD